MLLRKIVYLKHFICNKKETISFSYIPLFVYIFFSFFLLVTILKIISYFSIKEKKTDYPFECGIIRNYSSHLPYSLPFFFLTLIFLLFDVEIILLLPYRIKIYIQIPFILPILIIILSLRLVFE